jgi:F0F1-type ATP synthase assembly protein I
MLAAWLAWLTWGASTFAGVGRAHWLPMVLTLWLVMRLGKRLAGPQR